MSATIRCRTGYYGRYKAGSAAAENLRGDAAGPPDARLKELCTQVARLNDTECAFVLVQSSGAVAGRKVVVEDPDQRQDYRIGRRVIVARLDWAADSVSARRRSEAGGLVLALPQRFKLQLPDWDPPGSASFTMFDRPVEPIDQQTLAGRSHRAL